MDCETWFIRKGHAFSIDLVKGDGPRIGKARQAMERMVPVWSSPN